jgi:hypothetical protein
MVVWKSGVALAVLCALPVWADATAARHPIEARYATPTNRYPHNIMGSLRAHSDLFVRVSTCETCQYTEQEIAVRLPENLVFEDFAPRLKDLNGDGLNEVVVVESDQSRGSRLAVWDVIATSDGPKLVRGAAGSFVGTRFRWLAPIGAADFDGDGFVEFAYVEKPHLDKVLRIVRRDGEKIVLVASIAGVTNHAIGQERAESRIDICADGPRIIALDATGMNMVSVMIADGEPKVTVIGPVPRKNVLGAEGGCEDG